MHAPLWNNALLALSAATLLLSAHTGKTGRVPSGLYEVDAPGDDALTPEKITLGEKLFFDNRLSKAGLRSCASCHDPKHGFAEDLPVTAPAGLKRGERNSQSVINSGYRRSLGWDGRFRSLEDQVRGSFSPWGDMGVDLATAIQKVEQDREYQHLCRRAFGRSLDSDCLVRAIAAYERSLVRGGSRFDKFLFEGERSALRPLEIEGWELFKGRAGCVACHDVFHTTTNDLGSQYALFSDERFHNLGVGYSNGRMSDPGRYSVSRERQDLGAFKTPMLRDVSRTAPYMHDGSLTTLYDVVTFYNKGGVQNPNLSAGMKPLYLTENEKLSLIAFLKSLDSLPAYQASK